MRPLVRAAILALFTLTPACYDGSDLHGQRGNATDGGAGDSSALDAAPIDAPVLDGHISDALDASMLDAPMLDAPMPDAPMPDAAMLDAAPLDGSLDARPRTLPSCSARTPHIVKFVEGSSQHFANGDGLIAAYFDADAHLDLAFYDGTLGKVLVLLGRGDGSFDAPLAIATSAHPTAIGVGDFNGDGATDIVTTDSMTAVLTVLLNQGDGRAFTQQKSAVGGLGSDLAVGDLDGDGRADLVLANADNTGSVVLNTRNAAALFPVELSPRLVSNDGTLLGDLDKDGRLDLLGATNDHVVWWRNVGGAAIFDAQQSKPLIASGTFVEAATGDLDGDGRSDVLVGLDGSRLVAALAGTAGVFTKQLSVPTVSQPHALIICDFDGDGIADVGNAELYAQAFSYRRGAGGGALMPPLTFSVLGNGTLRAYSAVAGDFDEDGSPDLVLRGDNTGGGGGTDLVTYLNKPG